jgi:hypothetical protein
MTNINADSQTPIDLRHAGTTGATAGFTSFDGINATIFGDPNGEVPGTFQCPGGGILAFGGPWAQGTHQAKGKTWKTATGADIVFNNGIDCLMAGNPSLFEETWAHEALHALGLGHSCGDASSPSCAGNALLDGALMRALAHDDGRGAQLNADDLAGLRSIYAAGGGSTGPCVANATTMCLNGGRFRVTIDFNPAGVPPAAAKGSMLGGDSAAFTFFDVNNVEALVKVLNACGLNNRYWVFAAGLTNVRVVLTVTDTAKGTTKTYTNPQGQAFQPIQDTAAFATCP